jgi:serine/threonine protein kinase
MTTPERWARIERLFHEALARGAHDRGPFLTDACAGDDALRCEVESLLAYEGGGAFLSTPALPNGIGGGIRIGQALGPYVISAQIGEGGMGEVYRARDAKLGRDVAIKILPRAFAADPHRLARFEREARMLASLNHPHIGAIYGVEESNGVGALVLELVEGETLAAKLAGEAATGKGLPIQEALAIARQIADALEAAHEQGIIHRDLKPANIMVRPDGTAKVLDFGLAKVMEPIGAPSDVSQTPTMTIPAMTQPGTILGTAAYMSPEQARGRVVDKRTDIWAFGCVLYEMLSGHAAFGGDTLSDTLAAIIEREPNWKALPELTPSSVRRLLRRCLEKDPKRRLPDIADARIEIDDAQTTPSDSPSVEPTVSPGIARSRTPERVGWVLAAACLAGLVAALVFNRGGSGDRTPADLQSYSTSIVLPAGVRLWSGNPPGRFVLSPDGRQLAMVASDSTGRSMLWVRPLDSRVAQALSGTEGATYPFWSADSRSIAFLAQNKLKKIGVSGGEVVTLCDASFGSSGAWNRDDVILFTPNGNSPLYRVSASGGTPTQVTTLETASGDVQHSFPFFLPDGRHFLYFVVGSQASRTVPRGVYVGALDSKEPGKLIEPGGSNAKYANGQLVFLRNGALLAQPFDVGRLELGGTPVSLADQVQTTVGSASDVAGAFTVSETGVLAYQTGSLVRSQLTWFDRAGTQLATLGDQADYVDVALSPDDTRVAVSLMDLQLGTRDLWIFDVARRLGERFTYESGDDFGPNWSRPGGGRIFFSSLRKGSIQLYEKPSSGSGSEALLLEDHLGKFNASSSPDGQHLVYVGGGGIISQSDIWVLPLIGERKSAAFLETSFIESQGQFSPDGRWVAFMSFKSGRPEVYVTPFPRLSEHDTEQLVSTAGGSLPRWNRNGKEIFYLTPDNTLRVTPVNGQTSRFVVGTGRPLFSIHPRPARLDAYPYDVTSDGQRILVNSFVEEVTPPITLIVNWRPKR